MMFWRKKVTKKQKAKKPVSRPVKKQYETSWRAVNEMYSMCRTLQEMLSKFPDKDLAEVKAEMYVVEDLLWQAVSDRRN